MNQIVEEITRLITPDMALEGVELVDLTYRREPVGWVLRVFIEKSGGVNLHDCEVWSDRISGLLDNKALITIPYHLEVSSPGINRPLRKRQDFDRFSGEKVKIKLYAPLSGKRNFSGILRGMRGENVLIEEAVGVSYELPFSQIARAGLDKGIEL